MIAVAQNRPESRHRRTKTSPNRGRCGATSFTSDERREEVLRLLRHEIGFISSKQFSEGGAETAILGGEMVDTLSRLNTKTGLLPRSMPAHLARLCEADVLSREEERNLFRAMNYLKFRANVLRSRLDPDAPDLDSLEQAKRYLHQAEAIRDLIVLANTRLVVALVKKYVTPQCSFDDLLSDGIRRLILVVGKFDFERGFRFSTYAYRSLAREAYRVVVKRKQQQDRTIANPEIVETVESKDGVMSSVDELRWQRLREMMGQFVDRLDRRERFIIRSRYALGAHRTTRTFQYLADRLGLSKERVRQLEQRAVAKMQEMAGDRNLTHVADLEI
jgi:RNA polymerase primary sigma factor